MVVCVLALICFLFATVRLALLDLACVNLLVPTLFISLITDAIKPRDVSSKTACVAPVSHLEEEKEFIGTLVFD